MIGSFFKFITPTCCRSNRAVVENNNTARNRDQNSYHPVEVTSHIIPPDLVPFVDTNTTAVEISSNGVPLAYAEPLHDDNIKSIPYNNTKQDEILIAEIAPPPTITRNSTIFKTYQKQRRLAIEKKCVGTFQGAFFDPDSGIVL